jgi:MFS superfamily sulfate permease-like transporter
MELIFGVVVGAIAATVFFIAAMRRARKKPSK